MIFFVFININPAEGNCCTQLLGVLQTPSFLSSVHRIHSPEHYNIHLQRHKHIKSLHCKATFSSRSRGSEETALSLDSEAVGR